MKRHKIKREKPEPSGSYSREQEEHDLAYYIHDRVELMHQVFSALKPKDLKAMTPACIRHLSIDNIKELCTEELLGISSKRLCAILDGADPPTDTESSLSASPERLETISLDSISSDEEILSQASKKSKKKHRHRGKDRDKSKKKKKSASPDESAEKSRASRAGLTVLELLELQARARAIRAQLQQEQAAKQLTEAAESSQDASSDDEVLVKEEPPEVLVISSDDEKPSIAELETEKQNTSTETEKTEDSQKVTKRINNLVITVPQSKPTRKIKLNRTKSNPAPAPDKASTSTEPAKSVANVERNTNVEKTNNVVPIASKAAEKDSKTKEKLKKKQKKKEKKKEVDKDGSDQDEIMLQLSDSEKLDLLEDLGHKNYDKVSSQSSEDSESSSSSSSESDDDGDGENGEDSQDESKTKENKVERIDEKKIIEEQNLIIDQNDSVEKNKAVHHSSKDKEKANVKSTDVNNSDEKTSAVEVNSDEISSKDKEILEAKCEVEIEKVVHNSSKDKEDSATITIVEEQTPSDQSDKIEKDTEVEKIQEVEKSTITDRQVTEVISQEGEKNSSSTEQIQDINETIQDTNEMIQDTNETVQTIADCEIPEVPKAEYNETSTDKNLPPETCEESTSVTLQDKNDEHKPMSDGELSDQGSSEVEATELQPEVVCISDDEKKSKKSKKKHKKKEKKNKKEKKSKKEKSDFRNGSDQNFYKDSESLNRTEGSILIDNNVSEPIVIDEDDIYEILELSDDSSCYEVEGTVLSKEPTAEEIEALSAKIDEIERIEVITDEEIRQHEQSLTENNETDERLDDIEQISWKDRYLGSKKVKKVLTTSNILNALRKKNKELKKKLEESKTKEHEVEESDKVATPEKQTEINLEEGSIEQYNTLQGSTKYVDPVKEPEVNTEDKQNENKEGVVTKEMKKDAKQLLKMYKRLLKYNDINKQKDPNKKKKKKLKKKSKDSESVASVVNNDV